MSQDNIVDAFRTILQPIISEAIKTAVPQPETKSGRRLYTREQVQKLLGIKKTAFYDYINKKKLTVLVFEGKRYIDADRLDADIKEKEVARYKHI